MRFQLSVAPANGQVDKTDEGSDRNLGGFEAFAQQVIDELRGNGADRSVVNLCWSSHVGKRVRFPDAPASPEGLGFCSQHSRRFHWSGWRRKNSTGYKAFKEDLTLLLSTFGSDCSGIVYGTEVDWDSSQDNFDDETTKIYGWGFIEFPLCISQFRAASGDQIDVEVEIKLLAPRTLISEVVFEPSSSKTDEPQPITLLCEAKSNTSSLLSTIWRAKRPNCVREDNLHEITGTLKVIGAALIGDSVSRIQLSLLVGSQTKKNQGRTKSDEKHRFLQDTQKAPTAIAKNNWRTNKRVSKCLDDLAVLNPATSLNPPLLKRVSFAPSGQPAPAPRISVSKVPTGAVWRKSNLPCFDSLSASGTSGLSAVKGAGDSTKQTKITVSATPTVPLMLLKPINTVPPWTPVCKVNTREKKDPVVMSAAGWQEVTTKLLSGQIFHPTAKFTSDLLLANKNNSFTVPTISMLLYSSCPILEAKPEGQLSQLELTRNLRPIQLGDNHSTSLKTKNEGGPGSIFTNLFSGASSSTKVGASADRLRDPTKKVNLPVVSPSILSLFNLFILSPNMPEGIVPPYTTSAGLTTFPLSGTQIRTQAASPYSQPFPRTAHPPTLASLITECLSLSTFTQHQSFAAFTLALAAGPFSDSSSTTITTNNSNNNSNNSNANTINNNNTDTAVVEQLASLPPAVAAPETPLVRIAGRLGRVLCTTHQPQPADDVVFASPQAAADWLSGLCLSTRCRLLGLMLGKEVRWAGEQLKRIAIETLGEIEGWGSGLLPDVVRPVNSAKLSSLMPATVYSIMWEDGLFQGGDIWDCKRNHFDSGTDISKAKAGAIETSPSQMKSKEAILRSPMRAENAKQIRIFAPVATISKIESWTNAYYSLHECTTVPFVTSELSVDDLKLRVLLTKDTLWIVGMTPGKLMRFTAEILDPYQEDKAISIFSGAAFGQPQVSLGWKYARTSSKPGHLGLPIVCNSRKLKLTIYTSPLIQKLVEAVSLNFSQHFQDQQSVPKIKRWQAFDPNFSASHHDTPISNLRLSNLSDEPVLSTGRAHEIVNIFDPEFSLTKQAFSLQTLSCPLLMTICYSDCLTISANRGEEELVEFALCVSDTIVRGVILSAVRLNWLNLKTLRGVLIGDVINRKEATLTLHERCKSAASRTPSGYHDDPSYDSRPRNCYKGRTNLKRINCKDLLVELEAILRYLDSLPLNNNRHAEVITVEEYRKYENLVKSEQRRLQYEEEIASLKKKLTRVMKDGNTPNKGLKLSTAERHAEQKPGFLNTLIQAMSSKEKPTPMPKAHLAQSGKSDRPNNFKDIKFDSMADSESDSMQHRPREQEFRLPPGPANQPRIPDLNLGESFKKLSTATVKAIDDCNLI